MVCLPFACSKDAVDRELLEAGGRLAWHELRDRLVAKCEASSQVGERRKTQMGFQVLACVPSAYLSSSDEFVRLRQSYQRCTEEMSPEKRLGWKEIADDVLAAAGGSLPWPRLRALMVGEYCKAACTGGQVGEASQNVAGLGDMAMASLPVAYLSKNDKFVRLPAAAQSAAPGSTEVQKNNEKHSKKRKTQDTRTASEPLITKKPRNWPEGFQITGERAPVTAQWSYPLQDHALRCFVGHLPGALHEDEAKRLFKIVDDGTPWERTGPRWTAWMVRPPCSCSYGYGGLVMKPTPFPAWMEEVMALCMPLCGLRHRSEWPNSCNLNRYDCGWGSVGWHADDETLFQGKEQDCLIISLSLGHARSFHLRTWANGSWQGSVWLQGGDLCTMEGMMQKHYQHAVLKEPEAAGPRLNLTWRWIVSHNVR